MIDTVGSGQISNATQNGQNLIWLQGMAYPTNSVINGIRLHDATYARIILVEVMLLITRVLHKPVKTEKILQIGTMALIMYWGKTT